MKKVILINPSDDSAFNPLVYPPLGLLYLGAILEKIGYEVKLHDLREQDKGILNIPNGDFYCITAVTAQIEQAIAISQHIKTNMGGFTIIGGPHATALPEYLDHHFNTVVIGEGEVTLPKILEEKLEGVVNGCPVEVLEELPIPARHLLPESSIVNRELWEGYGFGNGPVGTTLITSRGCPYGCSFCANVPSKIRYRTSPDILYEIEMIQDMYDCNHFRFLDDNFIVDKLRVENIRNYFFNHDVHFRCSARSDLLDDELCEMLKASGCEEIGFGVETADDTVLKLINKGETVSDHIKAIRLAKQYGIKTKIFIMAGLPGETWETIEKNKRFIEETNPDKWICTLFTPYPGTPVWNNPEKYGVKIINKKFDYYTQTYPSKSNIETEVSNEELVEHHREMIKFLNERKK